MSLKGVIVAKITRVGLIDTGCFVCYSKQDFNN